jgi:hypothetical protein
LITTNFVESRQMSEKARIKSILEEARCDYPPGLVHYIEEIYRYTCQVEWKLKQEREKVRKLEQRLIDIEAIDGRARNDKRYGINQ